MGKEVVKDSYKVKLDNEIRKLGGFMYTRISSKNSNK